MTLDRKQTSTMIFIALTMGCFTKGGYPFYKMELYHYVYENLLEQGEEVVAIASWWQDDIWFQAITNQRLDGWDFLSADHYGILSKTAGVRRKLRCGSFEKVLFSSVAHFFIGFIDFWGNLVFCAPCIFWLSVPCLIYSQQRSFSHSVGGLFNLENISFVVHV